MAEVVLFSYQKGDSRIHRLHPTLKILMLFFVAIGVTYGDLLTLLYYIVLIGLSFYKSKISKNLFQMKYITLLAVTIFLFQVVLIKDITFEAIKNSILYVVRISSVILLGRIFTETTRPDDITPGIYNIIRSRRVAQNISLTIRLIPTFLISWSQIQLALKSRGLYLRKNPFIILKNITIPLLVETFKKSDSISNAMESRCYTGWVKCKTFEDNLDILLIVLTTLPHLLQIGMPLLQGL